MTVFAWFPEDNHVDFILRYPPNTLEITRRLCPESLHGYDADGRVVMISDYSHLDVAAATARISMDEYSKVATSALIDLMKPSR